MIQEIVVIKMSQKLDSNNTWRDGSLRKRNKMLSLVSLLQWLVKNYNFFKQLVVLVWALKKLSSWWYKLWIKASSESVCPPKLFLPPSFHWNKIKSTFWLLKQFQKDSVIDLSHNEIGQFSGTTPRFPAEISCSKSSFCLLCEYRKTDIAK